VEFMIFNQDTRTWIHSFYYTPVSSELQKMAEKVGDYLHSQRSYHSEKDEFWEDFRNFLEQMYRELEKANLGNMVGVPLLKPGTNEVNFTTDADVGLDAEGKVDTQIVEQKFGGIGAKVGVWVRYHKELPSYARLKPN
jgi:hypothetical protein